GASDRDAAGKGLSERSASRRARPVRLRLRRLSLQGTGAALLAAVRGSLSATQGGFPARASGEGIPDLAAVRLWSWTRRSPPAVGLVFPRPRPSGALKDHKNASPAFMRPGSPFRSRALRFARLFLPPFLPRGGVSEVLAGQSLQPRLGLPGDERLGVLE